MYRALCDICDLSKKCEDRKTHAMKMKMQKTTLRKMPPLITRQMNVFHDLTQTSDIPSAHFISNTGIITKHFEISDEHNYTRNNHAMKSIEEIVETEIL